jgi:hypothetical protein
MIMPKNNIHPKGEHEASPIKNNLLAENIKLAVDTYGGRVHVEWDPNATVTPLGQLPFFIEFLKLGGLFDSWVDDCWLKYDSPNSPKKRDLLGTLLLSILAGHTRYSHITAIRCDGVNPNLLGMNKIVSEDSMRRGLQKISQIEANENWLQQHLRKCYLPLLSVPWIMDVDTTVKVIYGRQEGAVVGYNPKKPGRPSHNYHSYLIANLRLVLDVEVHAGNESSSNHTAHRLWSLLDSIPRSNWPEFIRGDCAFGTNSIMSEAESRGLHYLFKLKQTRNVKHLIERVMFSDNWQEAGQGWEGKESSLLLQGWSEYRRVIILRRKILAKNVIAVNAAKEPIKQLEFKFGTLNEKYVYEYAVLVTSLTDEVMTIAQQYRDRADCENVFDELKNQWGWGGYTTQDLARCNIVARSVGLIYNWWNLFVRLAQPDKHLEAITSRPLLLHSIGKQTNHGGQTFITISTRHGKANKVKRLLNRIVSFFNELKTYTEQLTCEQIWYLILSKAVEKYLGGRQLKPPICI